MQIIGCRIQHTIIIWKIHILYLIFSLLFFINPLLFLSYGCKGYEGHTVANIGDPASEFELTDLNGRLVNLKNYKGKKVILNFWATWCPPCVKEMPLLQEAYNKEKNKGVEFIGINYNESYERINKFISDHRITFTILIDNDLKISMDYGVIGLPLTFFIDQNGIIKERYKGELTKELIEDRLNKI